LWRDCHDGVVDPIEDSRTHARLFLETCRAALQLQYQRVLDLEKAPRDRTEWRSLEPDCYLLVLALRQALVGIEAVAHFEGGAIEDLVDEATTTMATELGGLKDLRNMLTHFDDYLKGSGVLQRTIPDPDFDMHRKWRYNPHSGEVLLRVRAMGRSVEVLSMSRWFMNLTDQVQNSL
jgi:hypothetical protein